MKTKDTSNSYYVRYGVSFSGALIVTYLAFFAVMYDWMQGTMLAIYLLTLATVQFIFQLFVFLHVANEKKPRFTLWSVVYGILMIVVIVAASLWIMWNMNYNMHYSPEQMEDYMLEQNKKGF